MSKVLFVYPNKEGYPIIPLGISVIAGILKHSGHTVDVFDVTFMVKERIDHKAREEKGEVKKVDVEKYWGQGQAVDIENEFKKKISSFLPNIIAFSIVENNYGCARWMLDIAKKNSSALMVVGGSFPTIARNFFINDKNVDVICCGEGEYAMQKLAQKIDSGQDISHIPNLIVKKGKIFENAFGPYYRWDPIIFQEWEIFDKRHLLKPFIGKMWKTGFFEMSRGCPYGCTYCANRVYQKIFQCLGKYRREKPIESAIFEIEHMKKKYGLELIFFNDEHFLLMSQERFNEFCDKYSDRVGLPFFIQTRADTLLDEKRVSRLKEAGCITIGIGVESGSEKIRKELLDKMIPNATYERAFANCRKFKIRTTAYVMIGLPFETEKDIFTTAEFCKKLDAESIVVSIFAPYYGTKLREVCVNNCFMEDRYYENISINNASILNMPQLPKEKIEELYYKFNSLVYGAK
jgi:radical SAM superfamily enzyme YgiQ (UPF0313 family)